MNKANVEALAVILREIDGLEGVYIESEGGDVMEVALALASRGVLVPSALTEDELSVVLQRAEQADDFETLRSELERIAKGEAPA
jgi:hypothetical protein